MTVLIFTLCCVLGTAIYVKVVKPFLNPKLLNTTSLIAMFLIAMGLSTFALGAMYWAAGMYFGWTLVLSVTGIYVVAQYLVLRAMYEGERS